MSKLKKVLKILSVIVGIVLGIYCLIFIFGLVVRKSYSAIEFESMLDIFFENTNMSRPVFLNHFFDSNFFWYSMLRIVTLITLIILINLKNKAHRVIKYLGTGFALSACLVVFCGIFYNNIVNMADDAIVNILVGSVVFKPNLIIFGFLFLILGLFLNVIYSVLDVLYDERKNRQIINSK